MSPDIQLRREMRQQVTPRNATSGFAAGRLAVAGPPGTGPFPGRDAPPATARPHRPVHDPLPLQPRGRLPPHRPPLDTREPPSPPLRIYHDENVLAPVPAANVVRSVVQRPVAFFAHPPHHHVARQVPQHAPVLP